MRVKASAFRDETAVSTVLGAVLVTSLVVSTMVMVRVQYVPVWESNAEAQQMMTASRQLAEFKSTLDREVAHASGLPISHVLSMKKERTGIMSEPQAPGHLGLAAGQRTISLGAPRLVEQNASADPFHDVVETWTTFAGNGSIDSILEVGNFRLRLDEVSKNYQGTSWVIEVRNATNVFAGRFTIDVQNPGGTDYVVNVQVHDEDGFVLFDQPTSIFQGSVLSPFWIDLLNPTYRFDRVLRHAATPFSLHFFLTPGPSGAPATKYTIAYLGLDEDQAVVPIGTGTKVFLNYSSTWSNRVLEYEANNGRYVDQTFLLEHGALILQQQDGAVFRLPPAFQVSHLNNLTLVAFSLPLLGGSGGQLDGGALGTIRTRVLEESRLEALVPSLALTISTAQPALWAAYWEEELRATGLSPAGPLPGYQIQTTSSTATLLLHGADAAVESQVYDIGLTLLSTRFDVAIGS